MLFLLQGFYTLDIPLTLKKWIKKENYFKSCVSRQIWQPKNGTLHETVQGTRLKSKHLDVQRLCQWQQLLGS